MAVQRYISTSFWDDEWIQTLDPSEKLLYLYLMTNPLTNIAGVYEITIRRMCFDTGFNADTIKYILAKFEKAKKAYYHKGYIVIPAWPQHQKPESRLKIKQGIDIILKKLPQEMIDYIISVRYRYNIGSYVYDRNYSDSDSDSDTDTDIKIEAPTASPPAPIRTKAVVAKKNRDEDSALYQYIKESFEKVHGDFADYAKEGAAIKRIIKLTNGDAEAVRLMLQTFYKLYKSNDKYWSSMPFIPSRLASSGVWEGVKEVAAKSIVAQDVSWVDEFLKEDAK